MPGKYEYEVLLPVLVKRMESLPFVCLILVPMPRLGCCFVSEAGAEDWLFTVQVKGFSKKPGPPRSSALTLTSSDKETISGL